MASNQSGTDISNARAMFEGLTVSPPPVPQRGTKSPPQQSHPPPLATPTSTPPMHQPNPDDASGGLTLKERMAALSSSSPAPSSSSPPVPVPRSNASPNRTHPPRSSPSSQPLQPAPSPPQAKFSPSPSKESTTTKADAASPPVMSLQERMAALNNASKQTPPPATSSSPPQTSPFKSPPQALERELKGSSPSPSATSSSASPAPQNQRVHSDRGVGQSPATTSGSAGAGGGGGGVVAYAAGNFRSPAQSPPHQQKPGGGGGSHQSQHPQQGSSTKSLKSMFESGDFGAGGGGGGGGARDHPERDVSAEYRESAGRHGHKIDDSALDVNSIKDKWRSGSIASPEEKQQAAVSRGGEDAMFRCNTASAKTGGVLNISAKFDPEGAKERGWEGEGSDPNSSRMAPAIKELAEQIHFDPNTMQPGAQHPMLNYENIREFSAGKDWRHFDKDAKGLGRVLGDDTDDEPLPPPTGSATNLSGLPLPGN